MFFVSTIGFTVLHRLLVCAGKMAANSLHDLKFFLKIKKKKQKKKKPFWGWPIHTAKELAGISARELSIGPGCIGLTLSESGTWSSNPPFHRNIEKLAGPPWPVFQSPSFFEKLRKLQPLAARWSESCWCKNNSARMVI